MALKNSTIWTVSRIADHLGVTRHRVEYLIDARAINPTATAGNARIFAQQDVDLIGQELQRITSDRQEVRLEA